MRTIETAVITSWTGASPSPPPGCHLAVLVPAPEAATGELPLHTSPLTAFPADCRFSRSEIPIV